MLLRGIAWAGKHPVDSLLRDTELASFRYPAGGPTAPADAAKKIRVSREFDLSLVAAEPFIVKPIAIDWDAGAGTVGCHHARVSVQTGSLAGKGRHPDSGRCKWRRFDGQENHLRRRPGAADQLRVPSRRRHRLAVAADSLPPPDATDGDGKADRREVLFSGFGTYDTHAVVNNLRWGFDGWIYGCQGYSGSQSTNIVNNRNQRFGKIGNGIFRFKPDASAIEQVASYGGNSWGIDFNEEGELFFSMANGPHINHVVMPERYLARGKLGNAASTKSIKDHQKVNPIFGDTRHEYIQVAPVGVFTAASGCTLYTGGAWPEIQRAHSLRLRADRPRTSSTKTS